MVKSKSFRERLRESSLRRKAAKVEFKKDRLEFNKELKAIRRKQALKSEEKRLQAIGERQARQIREARPLLFGGGVAIVKEKKPKKKKKKGKGISRQEFIQPQRRQTLAEELGFLKGI